MKHDQNTEDITSLKSSANTIKWIMGGVGAFLLFGLSYLASTLNTISSDVKTTSLAAVRTEEQVRYLSARVERVEQSAPRR